jgi:hypothetical protein
MLCMPGLFVGALSPIRKSFVGIVTHSVTYALQVKVVQFCVTLPLAGGSDAVAAGEGLTRLTLSNGPALGLSRNRHAQCDLRLFAILDQCLVASPLQLCCSV